MDPDFARQYYESAEREHWWFRGRARMVENLLTSCLDSQVGRVVDLGAGSVSLFPSGFEVVKVDMVVPEGVEGHFVKASVVNMPFRDASFVGAGLFDVLEHLDDPEVVLGEARRIVGPGGFLVYTVPAFQSLWSKHDELVGHVRRYRPTEVRQLLARNGFEPKASSMFYGFLLGPAVVRKFTGLPSPMALPPPRLNNLLTRLAVGSANAASRSNRRLGLSISGVAFRS
ncbi:MAG TPA: class I SAM-dependent methyltransferase [Acidimicrobiia bacterium]|nr:class I SAM-dependent methyltransferase [Acidimicrobiia bacterium]